MEAIAGLLVSYLTSAAIDAFIKSIGEDGPNKEITGKLTSIFGKVSGLEQEISNIVEIAFLYNQVKDARSRVLNAQSEWAKATKHDDPSLWAKTLASILKTPSMWDKLADMHRALSDPGASAGKISIIPHLLKTWWAQLMDPTNVKYGVREFQADWESFQEAMLAIERVGTALFLQALGAKKQADDPKWIELKQTFIDDSNARTQKWRKLYTDLIDTAPAFRVLLDECRRQTDPASPKPPRKWLLKKNDNDVWASTFIQITGSIYSAFHEAAIQPGDCRQEWSLVYQKDTGLWVIQGWDSGGIGRGYTDFWSPHRNPAVVTYIIHHHAWPRREVRNPSKIPGGWSHEYKLVPVNTSNVDEQLAIFEAKGNQGAAHKVVARTPSIVPYGLPDETVKSRITSWINNSNRNFLCTVKNSTKEYVLVPDFLRPVASDMDSYQTYCTYRSIHGAVWAPYSPCLPGKAIHWGGCSSGAGATGLIAGILNKHKTFDPNTGLMQLDDGSEFVGWIVVMVSVAFWFWGKNSMHALHLGPSESFKLTEQDRFTNDYRTPAGSDIPVGPWAGLKATMTFGSNNDVKAEIDIREV